MKSFKVLAFGFLVWILFFPKPALAYIDPGAGSYVFQLFLGFLFGGLVIVKMYWKKIKLFFINLFGKKPHEKKNA